MRVLMLMVKDVEARARRSARAALAAGHEVELIVRDGRDAGLLASDPATTVRRLGLRSPVPRKLARLLTLPLPLNPVYLAAFAQALRRFDPDVIHVHDLPLVLMATAFGGGRPVVYDLHENYPAMVRTWTGRGRLHRLLLSLRAYDRWEDLALEAATHFLVVCDEQGERLEAKGVAPDRITIVGNTPRLEQWQVSSRRPAVEGLEPDDEVIFYSGYLNAVRGVDLLVEAMPDLLLRRPRARLLVVGDGEVLPSLRARARELGVEGACLFPGWVSLERLQEITERADVCVVPHRQNEHTETTYPNKLLEFLALGKAVVVSPCRPLVRILGEAEGGPAGRVATDGMWSSVLAELLEDPETRAQLARRGRRLVEERYHEAVDMERLLELYESLVSSNPRTP